MVSYIPPGWDGVNKTPGSYTINVEDLYNQPVNGFGTSLSSLLAINKPETIKYTGKVSVSLTKTYGSGGEGAVKVDLVADNKKSSHGEQIIKSDACINTMDFSFSTDLPNSEKVSTMILNLETNPSQFCHFPNTGDMFNNIKVVFTLQVTRLSLASAPNASKPSTNNAFYIFIALVILVLLVFLLMRYSG